MTHFGVGLSLVVLTWGGSALGRRFGGWWWEEYGWRIELALGLIMWAFIQGGMISYWSHPA